MSKLFNSSVRTTARKAQLKRTVEMREKDLEFIVIILNVVVVVVVVVVELLCLSNTKFTSPFITLKFIHWFICF